MSNHNILINEPKGIYGMMLPQRSGSVKNIYQTKKQPFISRVSVKEQLGLPPVGGNKLIIRRKKLKKSLLQNSFKKSLNVNNKDFLNATQRVKKKPFDSQSILSKDLFDNDKFISNNTQQFFWKKNKNPLLEYKMNFNYDKKSSGINSYVSSKDRNNFGKTEGEIKQQLAFEEGYKGQDQIDKQKNFNSLSTTNFPSQNEKQCDNKKLEPIQIEKSNLRNKNSNFDKRCLSEVKEEFKNPDDSECIGGIKILNIKKKPAKQLSPIKTKSKEEEVKEEHAITEEEKNNSENKKIEDNSDRLQKILSSIDEEKLKNIKVNMDDLKDDEDDFNIKDHMTEDEMKDLLSYIGGLDFEKYSKDMEIREALVLIKSKMEKELKEKEDKRKEENNEETNDSKITNNKQESEKNNNEKEENINESSKNNEPHEIINEEEEKKKEEIEKFKVAEKLAKDERLKAVHSYQSVKKILERLNLEAKNYKMQPLRISVIKEGSINKDNANRESHMPFLHSLPLV